MVKPIISVIIPVYNAQKTIKKCLDSVLNSEFTDYEIIVVNDGSIDNSMNVIEKIKQVKIIEQENQGSAAARNNGAAIAEGVFLLFLDADVTITEKTIGDLLSTSKSTGADLVQPRYSRRPLNPGLSEHYKAIADYVNYIPRRFRKRVFINGIFSGGIDFIRAEVFHALGGYDTCIRGASVEREDFFIRFFSHGYKSAADPNIVTWHHFPGPYKLFESYVNRIYGSLSLLEGEKVKLSYISKFDFVFTPIAAAAFIIVIIKWVLLDYLLFGVALNLPFVIAAAALYVYSVYDFALQSVKVNGCLVTLQLLPIHAAVSIFILAVASVSCLRLKLERWVQ